MSTALFAVRLLAPFATEAFRFERQFIARECPCRAPPVFLSWFETEHLGAQFVKLLFERGEALLDCLSWLSRGCHDGGNIASGSDVASGFYAIARSMLVSNGSRNSATVTVSVAPWAVIVSVSPPVVPSFACGML
jgi:hypothetical protein